MSACLLRPVAAGLCLLLAACWEESGPPRIESLFQSSEDISTGRPILFRVTARDPGRQPLTFAWEGRAGLLDEPRSGPSQSELSWTPPVCAEEDPWSALTVTVTNPEGLSASATFTVTGASPCPLAEGWTHLSMMTQIRIRHTATLLPSGKVLVAGGRDWIRQPDNSETPISFDTAELYDPSTRTWSPTGRMNRPRGGHSAVLLSSGKVLVVGGSHDESAELYDPDTGTWTLTGSTAEAHGGTTATVLGSGEVLVTDGITQTSAELYDPDTGLWRATGRMKKTRGPGHAATLLGSGKVLITGGTQDGSAELYDPETGAWTLTGSMNEPGVAPRVVRLPSGQVLSVAVSGESYASRVTELYDPATERWTVTGSRHSFVHSAAAALLPGGKVLVSGGRENYRWVLWTTRAAEIYDPALGTWTPTSTMQDARFDHQMTVLRSGRVLVTGGQYDHRVRLQTAEEFGTPRSP